MNNARQIGDKIVNRLRQLFKFTFIFPFKAAGETTLGKREHNFTDIINSHFSASDVCGVFDYPEDFTVVINDGAVSGLDPNVLSAIANAVVFTRLELTICQLFPEQAVLVAGTKRRINKHAVMLALYFAQGVTHCIKEVVVGFEDFTGWIKFNNCLGLINRFNLAREIGVFAFFFGNISGVFYYSCNLTITGEYWIVGCLNPYFFTAAVETQEFP